MQEEWCWQGRQEFGVVEDSVPWTSLVCSWGDAAGLPPWHLTGEDKSLGARGGSWSLGLNTRGLHGWLWSNIIRGTSSIFWLRSGSVTLLVFFVCLLVFPIFSNFTTSPSAYLYSQRDSLNPDGWSLWPCLHVPFLFACKWYLCGICECFIDRTVYRHDL